MILTHHLTTPRIHETAFVAPSADIIGEVEVGAESSVWFQVVIRGDVNSITIGSRTNIQDHAMLHVSRPNIGLPGKEKGSPLKIGNECTIAHRVTLHGCTIGNRVLVGMGAIIMDDAVIGDDCIIGAGALVTQGTVVPSGSLVMGVPAKVARPLKPAELTFLPKSAANYVGDSRQYMSIVRGPGLAGRDDTDLTTEELDEEDDEYSTE
jgi:carbonic anhydrase/acetyltransferase-like protein (isoleucine patch superfamily)